MEFKRFIIQTKEIPFDEYRAVAKYFEKSRNYEYLDEDKPSWSIITAAAKLAPSLSVPQLLSIRNLILKNKIIMRNGAVRAGIHRYAQMYSEKSILEVSEEADYPPYHLLKMIIAFRGESPKDAEQFLLASLHDINSIECEAASAETANAAENHFINYLRGLGIAMRDQAQLVEEQRDFDVKLTPDALFDEPIYINDHLVHWIDFKNYVGANVAFTRKSNSRQAAKYTAAFGSGAIAYGKSVVAGYTIPDVYLLDVSSIMNLT